jgi:4-carboxymuconolactone decarboxylase
MASSDRYEKGRKAFKQVMRFDAPADAGGDPFLECTVNNLFGEVWARDGLSTRDRRLITIVVVTCLMQPEYMRLHMKAALENGEFTATELKEAMVHLAYYAGWPVGTLGSGIASEVARGK